MMKHELFIGFTVECVIYRRQLAVLNCDEETVLGEIFKMLPDMEFYEVRRNDTEIIVRLKGDEVSEEWCDMIDSFYKERYLKLDEKLDSEVYVLTLRRLGSFDKWVEFAKNDVGFCYKRIEWEKRVEVCNRRINVFCSGIALDHCREFIIEWGDEGPLGFWTKMVRHQLRRFELSKVLEVRYV